ncbi:SH3-containing GRB2-like protein 3-interacting protein 1, partial [Anas platyrhynchos]
CPAPTRGKHFYSSSESEEEEEAHKKFNIKIKPLQAKDILKSAATVDELKASVGNIALSPSPVGTIKRNLSSEEIARPRRSTPTPDPSSRKPPEDPAALAPLVQSNLWVQFLAPPLDQPEIWGSIQPPNSADSPKLPRPFPTGRKPSPSKQRAQPLTLSLNKPHCFAQQGATALTAGSEQPAAEAKSDKVPSLNDLDSIFGPVLSPKSVAVHTGDKWVNFSDPSPENVTVAPRPREKAAAAPSSVGTPGSPSPPRHPISSWGAEFGHRRDADSPVSVAGSSEAGASRALRFTPTSQGGWGQPGAACLGVRRGPVFSKSFWLFDVDVLCFISFNLVLFYVFLQSRPFSPPIHSSSPPPIAPLARAESTSSISSTNSLSAATTPTVENEQPSLVWFDRGKFYLTFEACGAVRGVSRLTMGAQDTLPVAAAFTETVNAYFKGADPSKCIVKITGEMVLSFPAGITRHFANNPAPAVLTFRVLNYNRLEHVLPNPQLLCCDSTQSDASTKEFWVNMPNLMTHLKKVSEQKPQATYYNVDMLKYQVSAQGIQSTPLNLAVSWRCDPASTDLRIDYKYNTEAMTTPVALNNVQFLVPVDGGVTKLQAVLPPAVWNAEQQRILWKIPDISQKSENGG